MVLVLRGYQCTIVSYRGRLICRCVLSHQLQQLFGIFKPSLPKTYAC